MLDDYVPFININNFRRLTGFGRDYALPVEKAVVECLMRIEHRELLTALANDTATAPLPYHIALPAHLASSIIVTMRRRDLAEAEIIHEPSARPTAGPAPFNLWFRVPDPVRCQFLSYGLNLGYISTRFPDISKNSYTVYTHRIRAGAEGNLIYTGVTKQGWQKRWSQHVQSAKSGSMHLFHRALREHPGAEYMHRVVAAGLSEDQAMQVEEMWADHTLRPNGLNMIPGGYAGIRYLQKIGALAPREKVEIDRREDIIADFLRNSERQGRPNPLLAGLWRDDAFAEKVICGPEGRLKPAQIADARLLASFGKSASDIAERIGALNDAQVERLLAGSTYARIRSGGT